MATGRRRAINHDALHDLLERCVGKGEVTTYRDISIFYYGHPGAGQAVGQVVEKCGGCANNLTHRVVKADGSLRSVGTDEQASKLRKEGVPFGPPGRVDLHRAQRARLR